MRATQDPPQQVIDDCTKEVDEVLRRAQKIIFYIKLGIQLYV